MSQLIRRNPKTDGTAGGTGHPSTPKTTTGATAAVAVDDLLRSEGYTCEVKGVGVGGSPSSQVQSSIDGTTWTNEGSALTADGRVTITAHNVAFVRVNVTALATPGTATAVVLTVAGRQSALYGHTA